MSEATTETTQADRTLNQAIILVADDNTINLHFFTTVLSKAGATVVAVNNGNAAIGALRRQPFSLLLLDLQMPGPSGLDVIRRVRSQSNATAPETPIIAISAHLNSSQVSEVLDTGADACLIKPVSRRDLIEQCWQCLNGVDQPITAAISSASDPSQIWDRARANEIAGHDREIMTQMLVMFLEQLPDQHRAVNQAIRAHNFQVAREKAHRLQGSARFCATPALETAAAALHKILDAGQPDAIHQALGAFNRSVEQLQQYADERIRPDFIAPPGLR